MIKSLKDLNKLILLCRKNGIETIKLGDIELNFNPSYLAPAISTRKADTPTSGVYIPGGVSEDTKIQTQELTQDQLLFWSSNDGDENSKQ